MAVPNVVILPFCQYPCAQREVHWNSVGCQEMKIGHIYSNGGYLSKDLLQRAALKFITAVLRKLSLLWPSSHHAIHAIIFLQRGPSCNFGASPLLANNLGYHRQYNMCGSYNELVYPECWGNSLCVWILLTLWPCGNLRSSDMQVNHIRDYDRHVLRPVSISITSSIAHLPGYLSRL